MSRSLIVFSLLLVSACASFKSDYEERLISSLPNQREVSFSEEQIYPGQVLCGKYASFTSNSFIRETRSFIVTPTLVMRYPDKNSLAVFCSDEPAKSLNSTLGIAPENTVPAYEDPAEWIVKEGNLPENVTPENSKLKDPEERARIADLGRVAQAFRGDGAPHVVVCLVDGDASQLGVEFGHLALAGGVEPFGEQVVDGHVRGDHLLGNGFAQRSQSGPRCARYAHKRIG